MRLAGLAAPGLNEQVRDHEGGRILEMPPRCGLQLIELIARDQPLCEQPIAQVLDEVRQDEATAVAWLVEVHDRARAYVDEAGIAKQSWHSSAHEEIDPVDLRVQRQNVDQSRPRLKRGIADVRNPVGLMKRDRPPRAHKPNRLGNNLFRLGER